MSVTRENLEQHIINTNSSEKRGAIASIDRSHICLVVENSSIHKHLEEKEVRLDYFTKALVTISADCGIDPWKSLMNYHNTELLLDDPTSSYNEAFVVYGLKERIYRLSEKEIENSTHGDMVTAEFMIGLMILEQ